ncbi:hypothetical protein FQZ97_1172110 [compost metagenome]
MKTYLLILLVSICGVEAQEAAPRSVQKEDPLVKNFTENFNTEAWKKLIEK